MIDINRINNITQKFISDLQRVQQEVENAMIQEKKQFKLEQAEMIKNIILNSENGEGLENQMHVFQNELERKNKSTVNQMNIQVEPYINGMIADIKTVLKQGVQDDTQNQNAIPNQNNTVNQFQQQNNGFAQRMNNDSTPQVPNYAQSIDQINNGTQQQNINTQATPEQIQQSQQNNQYSQEALNEKKSQLSNSDVPIETKELDDWISEIKNLI